MDWQQHFELIGSGVYLPRRQVDAAEIDRRLGARPGWTESNVGVRRRFECAPPESIATMAAEAVRRALRAASVAWPQVDLILDCSTSRHRPIPCNAAHIQAAFGVEARAIPCFDVQSTCLGFIVALQVASALMQTAAYRHILIVCSEAPLAAVNWREAETAALFGDGAAAFLLRRSETPRAGAFVQQTYAEYLDACMVPGGGHLRTVFEYTPPAEAEYRFHMDGRALLRAVRRFLPAMFQAVLTRPQVDAERLHVVPHQASPKGLTLVRRWIGIPAERFHCRVADYGNMAAASIPLALHQCLESGEIRPDNQVMLLGTSAGYSQAAMVLRV